MNSWDLRIFASTRHKACKPLLFLGDTMPRAVIISYTFYITVLCIILEQRFYLVFAKAPILYVQILLYVVFYFEEQNVEKLSYE